MKVSVSINHDGVRFPIAFKFSALSLEDVSDGEVGFCMSVADARAFADRIVEISESASRSRPLTGAEAIRETTGVTAVDR